MIRTTRWSPDTCGCILEYSWDDAQAENVRVHTPSSIVKACPAHLATAANAVAHYNDVLGENLRKNQAFDVARAALNIQEPSQTELAEAGLGVVSPNLLAYRKLLGSFGFSFDAQRKLHVTVSGLLSLTAAQKANFQTALDTKFGAGKAVAD